MTDEIERATEPFCPVCRSTRVAPGAVASNGSDALAFSLLELEFSPWKFVPSYPSVPIQQPLWFCVACGLLWTFATDLSEAKRQIRAHGSQALQARTLNAGDALPRPAARPETDRETLPLPAEDYEP